jgi:hypothetical protein
MNARPLIAARTLIFSRTPGGSIIRGLLIAFLFIVYSGELYATFALCADQLPPKGAIWVAWPKKAAKISSDGTSDLVREPGLSTGLVDNKVCVIDATWTALRFVMRVRDQQIAQAQAPYIRTDVRSNSL